MVDLSSLLGDEDLRRRYGTPTLDRAWDYVRRGNVLSCTHDLDSDGDLDVRGTVAGSTSAPYTVSLSVGADGDGAWVFGRCSCPVGEGCKHALAVLITVRDEQARTSPQSERRWERQLSSLLDELDDRAAKTQERTDQPLALQVELKPPARSTAYRGWSRDVTSPRGTLRMRPMRRGARDNWVRSGISWSDVPYLDRNGAHPPEQVVALNDLLSGHRTGDAAALLRRRRQRGAGVLRARRGVAGPARRRGRDAAAARDRAVLGGARRPGHPAARRQRRARARRPAAARGPAGR